MFAATTMVSSSELTQFVGSMPLVAAMESLTSLYVIALIIGGGLLVVSTIFGGDGDVGLDADVDVDFDVDVDLDVDVDVGDVDLGHAAHASGLSLASWFSMQFVVFFVAAFGLIGTVLSLTSSTASSSVLIWSLVGGLLIGQGAHQTMAAIRRGSGNSQASRGDYVNKLARVTLAIEPPKRGEVALQVRGRERFVPARSKRDDDRFATGDNVVITAFNSGTAEVVSKAEYEFITDGASGDRDDGNSDSTS